MSTHRDMGVDREDDMPGMPAMDGDTGDGKRYPDMHLSGAQAKKYGVEDLKAGDDIKQEVVWRVKSINKTETDGQDPNHAVSLELRSCTPPEKVDGDGEDNGEDDGDESDEPSSPALAYIEKHAAKD